MTNAQPVANAAAANAAATRSRVGVWEIHSWCAGFSTSSGGTPVTLIHGWGVSGRYLVPLARCLASDFPVHVPDLPGHGLSTKPPDALTLRQLADTLDAWMRHGGLERTVLVGHSFGSQIASEVAAQHPDRVAGLVLIGPTVDARARTLARQTARLILAGLWERASLPLMVLEDYRKMGLRRLRAELGEMFADAPEQRLPLLRVPALVIRGAHDAVVPLSWAREVAELLGGARVATVPDGGHAIQFSAPAAVAAEIRRFALGLPDASARNKAEQALVDGGVADLSRACPSSRPSASLSSPS